MNHVYRLIWSHALGAMVPVAEITRSKGGCGASQRSPARHRLAPLSSALLLALGLAGPGSALAAASVSTVQGGSTLTQSVTQAVVAPPTLPLPTGGQVVSGQATIGRSGNTLTIHQGSQNTILNWQSFSIGADQTVTFNQPNSSSVALNRVLGSDPSAIYGHLNANGQVFLVNPNGIYFARGAQVDVGGIVASTLDITNQDFLSGNYRFAGSSTAGVRNDGSINAANGGYVAFIGANVSNNGSIATPEGTTSLGAGGSVDLTLAGNSLLSFKVSSSALNALAQNGGVIQANGGTVILSAQAKNALLQTVVNNSGQIHAQTAQNRHGTIELLGGDSGTVQVGGTLDASAPNGGDGGFIETSGAHLKVADGSTLTTKATSGSDGQWLIDPYDFTIAASGGDITGAALSTALGSGNVTIQTTASNVSCTGITGCGTGNSTGNGDIFVNDTVSWSANTLTLNAYRNIVIDTAMNGSGTAGLALQYGQGSTNGVIGGITSDYTVNAPVNLPAGQNFSTRLGSSGSTVNWTVITSLGSAGDASTAPSVMTLQGMDASSSLTGNYVLGANIDASATATWNPDGFGGYYGFTPIGDGGGTNNATFTGRFDGLGHTVSNLTTIAHLAFAAGLFGYTSNSTIRDIGMVGGSVTGVRYAGGLVGFAFSGTIDNAYATGSVKSRSTNDMVGGLVGGNGGTINNAYATGSVNGSTNVGGLVGQNSGTGTINNAYATGSVTGSVQTGGLVGYNLGTISQAYASGSVTGSYRAGGLVGLNLGGTITNAYATGNVSGTTYVGGLIGSNSNFGTVTSVYATGHVSGNSDVGGLVGLNSNSTVTNGYWDITTTGKGTNAGYGFLDRTMTGGGGLTTAQLAAALPSGFASSNWGNGGNQTTPYLLSHTSFDTVSGPVILGTDTLATPTYYNVILNLTQLQNINSTGRGLDYVLGNNIDASATSGWNDGAGFAPIGPDYSHAFSGVFDGLGFSISNLTIHRSSSNDVGLFGFAGSNSVLRNVGLVGGSVSGYNNVGGLVGYTDNAKVSSAYNTGSVSGSSNVGGLIGTQWVGTLSDAYATGHVSGAYEVGGLVGFLGYATITNAHATGNVTGVLAVGGLAGTNYHGTIDNTYATGSATASVEAGGGLVGINRGTVGNAYATGNVSGTSNAGGLVGLNFSNASVSNAYATGNVSGSSNVGGLVGKNSSNSTISNAYATGSATGTSNVGGLIGLNSNSVVTNGYWDTSTGLATGIGANTGTVTGGGGLTTAQLAAALPSGFTSSVWDNIGNQTTPYLLANTSFDTYSGSVLLGTDTSGAQYKVITSLTQLQNINSTGLGLNYVLGNSIDASATASWNSGAGFAPLGSNANPYQGIFDGLGYTISNLTINRGGNYIGLFGDSGGTIRNIGLVGGSVSGDASSYAVGALVGGNAGTISNAYATTAVSGYRGVGGLVGFNASTIDNAHATGLVNGSYLVGGLVGVNAGTVTGVYATGNVNGQHNIGGLVGSNSNSTGTATIDNAYATGSIGGTTNVGGLVGQNSSGTISNAYATGNVTGGIYVGGLVGDNNGSNGVHIITNAYATGNVSGSYVGGLVGSNGGTISNTYATGKVTPSTNNGFYGGLVGVAGGTVHNSYWDTTTYGSTNVGSGAGIGLTTAQLAAALPSGFSSGVWANIGNQTTPYLLANTSFDTVSGSVLLGTDTSATPAQYRVINSLTQLQNINSTGLGLNYVLGNSIDASATATWNGGAGFAPIGNGLTGTSASRFTGTFDGLNFTISNFTINNAIYAGLFGYTSNAAIRNIGLANASVFGSFSAGALVGVNQGGTIDNAYATGSVVGSNSAGGLVGINLGGTIANTYATDTVNGGGKTGGLVGANGGSIVNAYATGSVTANGGGTIVGGLVGVNGTNGTITNAYATGSVSGINTIGALVGSNSDTSSTITNGYWDTSAGLATGIGANNGGTITGGGGLSTAQLAAALPSGFSSSVWANGSNQTTPYLLANTGFDNYSGSVLVGTDTSGAQYKVITSLTQLQNINSTGLGLDYVLGNSIDASATSGWNANYGFVPIGNGTNAYTGIFDGLNFTIDSLTVNRPGSNDIGLFGAVGSGGVLRNVGVTNVVMAGQYWVGGLAGSNQGSISNAYATGKVNSQLGAVGGLVGGNAGSISNAHAGASVSVAYVPGSYPGIGGGLVGLNTGSIDNAYATGAVGGGFNTTSIGGLVGENRNGSINNAYATATVWGGGDVGGLVGAVNGGTVSNAYATGGVSGSNSNVGGLIGSSTGTIDNVYATGSVGGGATLTGALIGKQLTGGTVSNGYWDTTVTSTLAGFGSNNGTVSGGGGLTTAQLAAALPSGFSSSVWANIGNQTTPYLLANTSFDTVSGSVLLGTETSATPAQYKVINSLTQLQNINSTGLSLNYVLGNNIDASATATWNGGAGFTPIGSYASAFSGTLDGLGYAISNLSINLTTSGSHIAVGLVGRLAAGGQIRNLGLQGGSFAVSMTGVGSSNYLYAGGLVGYSSGTIDHSYSTVSLTTSANGSGMHNDIGGLVGYSAGASSSALASITNSYTSGSINSQASSPSALWNYVGGLVGNAMYSSVSTSYASGSVSSHATSSTALWNEIGGLVGSGTNGSVSDSYATGSINSVATSTGGTFWNYVGGLIGSDFMGTVNTSYATGFVGSTTGGATFNSIGGLVGANASATVSNSFWDTETTGTPFSGGGTGLTTAQMLQQASFTGFDFTSPVWVIYQGHTMPLLNVFLTPLAVTAPNQSQTYTGGTFTLLNPSYSVAGADTSGHLFGLSNPYNGAVNVGSYSPDLWSDQQGYRITYVGAGLTITPKALTLSGLTAASKVYDGSTATNVTGWGSLTGIIGSDAVSLVNSGASAAFADANAGIGKTVTVGGLSLSGAGAGNYVINAQTSADITPKTLTLSGLTASNKVYDGSTAASIINWGSLGGVIGSDTVNLVTSGTTADFADANAGTGKTVTIGGLTLGGGAAGNYSLVGTQTAFADITPRPLTASLTGTIGKPYDGTTAATLSPTNFQLVGFVAGQGASVTQTVGQYASSAIGSGIQVGASLGTGDFTANAGTLLSNYQLPTSASGLGSISASAVPPSLTGAIGTAGRSVAWGYTGVNGFALALDPRLQWLQSSHGAPSTVSLLSEDLASSPPCRVSMNIDPFAAPATASACHTH